MDDQRPLTEEQVRRLAGDVFERMINGMRMSGKGVDVSGRALNWCFTVRESPWNPDNTGTPECCSDAGGGGGV